MDKIGWYATTRLNKFVTHIKKAYINMKNGLKLVISLAIGAVVGIVTYLNTKSDRVSNTNRGRSEDLKETNPDLNERLNSPSVNECQLRGSEVKKDGFLDFLGESQSGLEKLLRILKNIALSLEYMSKLFANSGVLRALPPAY